jgi:hypothetical protein
LNAPALSAKTLQDFEVLGNYWQNVQLSEELAQKRWT